MNGKSLATRIEALERDRAGDGDAEVLAWGQSVTDDELQQVARQPGNVRFIVRRDMDDAALFRIIRPQVEALRTQRAPA